MSTSLLQVFAPGSQGHVVLPAAATTTKNRFKPQKIKIFVLFFTLSSPAECGPIVQRSAFCEKNSTSEKTPPSCPFV
jgi:hypothetical protein